MSAQPQSVPIRSEIDDVDDEIEGDEAETRDGAPKSTVVGHLKSPIGMIAIGMVVVLLGGAGFLFGSGAIGGGGKPQLNSSAEDSITLPEGSETVGQVGAAITQTNDVVGEEDASPSTESAIVGADSRDPIEETKAPTYGNITYTDTGAIYHTSPTTVPLLVDGVSRDLTLSLGILADHDVAKMLQNEGLTVNLLTIEAAQNVDFGPFLDWEIPGLITKDLRARLEAKFPDANIRAIMIRDFQF